MADWFTRHPSMLRISCTRGDARSPVLELEGRLSGPWVDELDRVAAATRPRSGRLALDLSGLIFADARGVAVLRGLAEEGVEMRGCSPFLAELLNGAPR